LLKISEKTLLGGCGALEKEIKSEGARALLALPLHGI